MWLQIIKIFSFFFYFQFEDNSCEQSINMNHRSSLIHEYLPKEIETIVNQKNDQIEDVYFILLQHTVLFVGWALLIYHMPTIVDSIFNYLDSFVIDNLQRECDKPYNIESIARLAEIIKRREAINQWAIANRLEKGYNQKGALFEMLKESTKSIIYPEGCISIKGNLLF